MERPSHRTRETPSVVRAVAAAALLAVCGCSKQQAPEPSVSPRASAKPAARKPTHAEPPPTFKAKVVSALEGDLIEVEYEGQKLPVRLYGIDAPQDGQPFGDEARETCTTMSAGKTVTVETRGRDSKNRIIAEVTLPNGKSLNRALVWCGAAWWQRREAAIDRQLADCEASARQAKRGLWKDPKPQPPWIWKPPRVAKRTPPKTSSVKSGAKVRPQPPSSPPPARRPEPVTRPPQPSRSGNFTGNWVCVWGRDTIRGALTQRGSRVTGYCIYPNGARATFQGTASGNTMTGTLTVNRTTRRQIRASVDGNTMRGTWSSGGGKGNAWTATRQ